VDSGRPRVTVSTARETLEPPASWLPSLRRQPLDEPAIDRAAAWTTTDGRVLYGRRDGEVYWLWCPRDVAFRFGPDGDVEYQAGDYEDARRLWTRSALPLALEARGLGVLHASALSTGDACIAICGRSTAGKSTVASAAGHAGVGVEGDDALAFTVDGDFVVALTIPFEIRLRPPTLTAPFHGEGGKRLRLSHLVLLEPDVAATDTVLEPVSAGTALGELMPHAYCFSLDDSKDRLVRDYGDLVERAQVMRLRYRPTLDTLPGMVNALGSLVAR
jgi:hypothetical protein